MLPLQQFPEQCLRGASVLLGAAEKLGHVLVEMLLPGGSFRRR
jgi:hypothetical protein